MLVCFVFLKNISCSLYESFLLNMRYLTYLRHGVYSYALSNHSYYVNNNINGFVFQLVDFTAAVQFVQNYVRGEGTRYFGESYQDQVGFCFVNRDEL